jgi:PAS domain S-box-containing protein
MVILSLIFSVILNIALFILFFLKTKRTRNKLRQGKDDKKFLDLIFKNIHDALFIKDRYYRIVKANKTFLSLYPKDKRDKVIGTTTIENYDPKEAEEFLAEDRKAFDLGYTKTIETINFPDGEERTLITQKTQFNDDSGASFILGIATDITEQIQLQKETEKSQAMLRMITDFFPGMLYVKDEKSKIIFANDQLISMYPLEKQSSVIGSLTSDEYSEKTQKELLAHDQQARLHGTSTQSRELTFPNGVTMDVTITKTCFADNKGEEFLLCMITDNKNNYS